MKVRKIKAVNIIWVLLLSALFCFSSFGCQLNESKKEISDTTTELESTTAKVETVEWAKTLMGSVEKLEAVIEAREEELKNEFPTVNRKNRDKYLHSFKKCLKQLKKEGTVKEYRFNDYNIAIEFTCGGTYIYEPRINNCN